MLTFAPPDSRLNHDTPNVIHMTVKPQDYIEDEDAKGSKASYSGLEREQKEEVPVVDVVSCDFESAMTNLC